MAAIRSAGVLAVLFRRWLALLVSSLTKSLPLLPWRHRLVVQVMSSGIAAVQPLLAQCSERAGQHASSIAGAHQQRLKAQVEREVLRLANSNEIRDVLLQILPEAFGD